jgi:uncharacterized protein (DUF1697 family)
VQTYIAFFRGINVGGKNTLPMQALVAILEDLGARRVRTYIQSGNAVLETDEQDAALLCSRISVAIEQRRGFEPKVLLLTLEDLERAIRRNPFPEAEAEPEALHAGFLASTPEKPNLAALEGLRSASERFLLVDDVLYLHAPNGVGRSKLAANAERLIGVPMTDRNWRTVCKVRELAKMDR